MRHNPLQQLFIAAKTVLTQSRWYQVWFVLLSAIIFLAYIFLPVWLTPGNDLEFQLSLLRMKDYSLFVSLSFVTSLLILMQVFLAIRTKKYRERLRAVGGGGVSLFSSIFGGLLATAACSSCIAALVGFLGAGSVFFVFRYQRYVIIGAFVLVLLGLYVGAKQVNKYCENCEKSK